ncbi:hypothetical protein AALP_AA8G314400 [Arabis alpina]|uniref:SMP domain-containing protein n=1 Tax=Arabis alpina TaxID=50452 RepID=A0A087GAP7_ARAAL|nr:hypothetical protein AALP_AA8G314400 [Arabis alpina]
MRSTKDEIENDATVTNVSVEEHVSVSQSASGGQFVGPTEEISTALTEALKAAAINVGDKPVETTDLAAIKEVEGRATGEVADGIATMAKEAVTRNEKVDKKDEKTNLRDVIAEIDVKVTRDREVTSEDAEAVVQLSSITLL